MSTYLSIPGRVARPLLASIFISSGLDAVQHPESKVKAAEKVIRPLASHFDVVPDDTATAVAINGAVQVVGGALLSLGLLRRTAALLLIGSLIPTTLAGHRFWEEIDEQAQTQQLTQFLKNLGLLGGLVLVATEGRPHGKAKAPAATRGPRSPRGGGGW